MLLIVVVVTSHGLIHTYLTVSKTKLRVWIFRNQLKPAKAVGSRIVFKKWKPPLSLSQIVMQLFLF